MGRPALTGVCKSSWEPVTWQVFSPPCLPPHKHQAFPRPGLTFSGQKVKQALPFACGAQPSTEDGKVRKRWVRAPKSPETQSLASPGLSLPVGAQRRPARGISKHPPRSDVVGLPPAATAAPTWGGALGPRGRAVGGRAGNRRRPKLAGAFKEEKRAEGGAGPGMCRGAPRQRSRWWKPTLQRGSRRPPRLARAAT